MTRDSFPISRQKNNKVALSSMEPCFFFFALLFFSFSAHAQSTPSQIPTRPLLSEITQAERGTAATIHTHFSIGTGFFLNTGELVAARHSVLTPSGHIAEEIGVGFAQPPLNNIMESRSTAIAQDPVHDLVLLKIIGGSPLLAASAAEKAATVNAASQQALPCSALHPAQGTRRIEQVHTPHPYLHSVRTESPSIERPAMVDQLTSSNRKHSPASLPAQTPVHVVWDGPTVAPRDISKAAFHKELAVNSRTQVHVVWDGPLAHSR